MQARGLRHFSDDLQGPSVGWLHSDNGSGMGRPFLGSYGRVFDLTVVSRPQSASDRPRMATLEAALFERGRPVLLAPPTPLGTLGENRSEEHTSELQSLMRTSYAVFCLKKKNNK